MTNLERIVVGYNALVLGFVGAGTINGVLFGSLLLVRGFRDENPEHTLPFGLFLIVAGLAVGTMTDLGGRAGIVSEIVLTLAVGPLSLWTLITLLGSQGSAVKHLSGVALASILAFLVRDSGLLSVAAAWQWGFTCIGWYLYYVSTTAKPSQTDETAPQRPVVAIRLLGGLTTLHILQVYRIFFDAQVGFQTWIIPLFIASVLIFFVAIGWDATRWSAPPPKKTRLSATSPELTERIQILVSQKKIYLEYGVTAKDIAERVGEPSYKVSAAINSVYGMRLPELLTKLRLEHATNLLRSPEESETSIEAIALLSGFKSRSSFYEAFKREYDATPSTIRCSNSRGCKQE